MQLLILFLKNMDLIDPLFKALAENDIRGGTILDGHGTAAKLADMDAELPIIGVLRQYMNSPKNEETKLLLMVVKDEELIRIADVIKSIVGDLNQPNTGALITLPIMYCEGIR